MMSNHHPTETGARIAGREGNDRDRTDVAAEVRSFARKQQPLADPNPDVRDGGRASGGLRQRRNSRDTPSPRRQRTPRPAGGAVSLEALARVAHEVIRAWCEFNGDLSAPPWSEAPAWQRDSALEGVRFYLENPNADDGATHEAWLADKRRNGWTYGPVKDAEAKQHPCMVPFGQLPPTQQFKDRLFRTVVLAGLGGNV
jgi:hypothetical protein